ncbi:CapA family protein [Nocardia carnea]|uniref:CapA family protein n=1 Tax=Nocardia carnea TaxID=37328 RepID=UPI002453C37B|nr:CapA family protein [Nocardia carnea]
MNTQVHDRAAVSVVFVGDLILGLDDVRPHLTDISKVLNHADLAVGHLEWPHTNRGWVCSSELPAPGCPPENIGQLATAGFDVLTLAHNHTFDQGPYGIIDTIDAAERSGMVTVGAGLTIDEARRPVIVDRAGVRLGFLSYNSVGPRESWATLSKAGGAPIRVLTHYQLELSSPGSHGTAYTFVDPDSLREMEHDIRTLKSQVDVVCVAIHKGMIITRAELAAYERPLCHAAIDAGADVIIGHHSHMLRGVEVYHGRPIFHGVNHFITAYPDDGDPQKPSGKKRTPPRRSPILAQNVPDGTVTNYPFSTESRMTMVAQIAAGRAGVHSAGFIPAHIEADSVTKIYGDDELGRKVGTYVQEISAEAGLDTNLWWDGSQWRFL